MSQTNDKLEALQRENAELRAERDEARAEVARYWTSADMKPWVDLAEQKGLGHFGKKLKGMFSRAMKAEDDARQEYKRAEDLSRQLAEAKAELARMRAGLLDIANSDDIDNALDPERNKRVAKVALASPGLAPAEAVAAPVPDAVELVARIADYLTNGGLFNPEMMPQGPARDLLLDCRAALASSNMPVASHG